MTRNLFVMLLGAGMCLLLTNGLNRPAAADVEKAAASTRIAVVDMTRVMTTCKFFKQKHEALSMKLAEAQESIKKMVAEIDKMNKSYRAMDRTSEERKELEAKLRQKQKEAQEFQVAESAKYQKEEAELYLETYRRVSPEIANYAQEKGIDLVIHHHIDPPKANDPYAAWQTINRVVLYENKLDITEEIIGAVEEQ